MTAATPTALVIGQCYRHHPVVAPTAEVTTARCRQCGDFLRIASAQPILARPTLAKCGDACWAATGRLCECSCGGKQHGGCWMAVR